ncbi:Hypothetical protein PHPALM_12460 [Phytophthora palmivora]|uniref:FYVE-type domain-containing protein n=1 Tax=Phytophthora palmivora TaxID=4796 RepID=A0A2P4XZQ6_9STRA|nr:Hypothetical protein PHPALM_12460 [Phytophthora palmivora]
MCDDILATMPKLHAAVRNNAKGGRWKHSTGKGGVHLAEMKPFSSTVESDDDIDILYAVAAKTELRCHLNEALSVLLHQDSDGYDSTMKSLCGKQFKRGDVFYHQRLASDPEFHKQGRIPLESENDTVNPAAVSVTSATIRLSSSLKTRLKARHNRVQQLVLSSYTHQYSDKKRAVHLMKTVPKLVHDQVLPNSESSLFHRGIDHIGVGFDLQFIPHSGGSNRQCTQIFAHSYASDKPSRNFSKNVFEEPEAMANANPADLARRRVTLMNPEARQIMRTFTESLSQFERVIRRRRFGFQSFIYFPKEYADPLLEKRCLICNKTFHFFRRDFYCQLCGHMVCGDCSELYEVEARIGEIHIENHLNKELSNAQLKTSVEACEVSDRTRDYKYEFDSDMVAHEDLPLAPKPEAQKDARRVELIKSSGALQSDYDRSALDLIAQVAAKRLGCPIGVVSMIDDQQFHAVGNYNLPAEAHHLPRNEVPCMHSVYAEKPLVIKNPQRDMRFAKMPCVEDFGVKFYAGFPLRAPGGEVIGNLCTLDGASHNHISTKDYSTMETLAKLASDLLAPST